MDKIDQDWPYLTNTKKIIHRRRGEPGKKVVFMGDSITEFWSNVHPEFFQENLYQ
jgi:hypothetical protein